MILPPAAGTGTGTDDSSKRIWASYYGVLGITMLLLVASLLIILNLTTNAEPLDKATSSVVLLFLSVLPFVGHSVQLLLAIILANSRETGTPQHVSNCIKWCITSKLLGPTIILELLVLKSWKFDYFILTIILTLVPYLIALFKLTNVLRKRIVTANVAYIESRIRMILWGESIIITVNENESLAGGAEHGRDNVTGTTELPPAYDEVVHSNSTQHKNNAHYELPPHYNDIVSCQNEV